MSKPSQDEWKRLIYQSVESKKNTKTLHDPSIIASVAVIFRQRHVEGSKVELLFIKRALRYDKITLFEIIEVDYSFNSWIYLGKEIVGLVTLLFLVCIFSNSNM